VEKWIVKQKKAMKPRSLGRVAAMVLIGGLVVAGSAEERGRLADFRTFDDCDVLIVLNRVQKSLGIVAL
jgi:hypothetical protein